MEGVSKERREGGREEVREGGREMSLTVKVSQPHYSPIFREWR